jgi:hypothetical protein
VLHDPDYRAHAQGIAASMARARGVPRLAELVDELTSNVRTRPEGQ